MIVKKNQKGSALVYILVAIALLAALTAALTDSSSQQVSAQKTADLFSDIKSQAEYIRSAIQECVLSYPNGDPSAPATSVKPYPLTPTDTYLSSPEPTYNFAKSVRCPGNPGNSNNHAKIFSNAADKFFPPSPPQFGDWFYYNGPDGVFFYIASTKSDAFIKAALKKLDGQFSKCEADVVNASAATVFLTSAGASGVQCTMPNTCFRVWLVANPSNVYNGDADGDEVGCP